MASVVDATVSIAPAQVSEKRPINNTNTHSNVGDNQSPSGGSCGGFG